jgi:alanine racemase
MRYVAVVKADAYGHGLHQVAAQLMHAGADLFAVANVAEAAALRELGPGWPILVLSPLLPEEDPSLVENDLAATVSSAGEVARFDAVGRAAGRTIAVHLESIWRKVDVESKPATSTAVGESRGLDQESVRS